MNIKDYLLEDFTPVYGTGISPDAFTSFETDALCGWIAEGLTGEGESAKYTITVEPERGSDTQPDGPESAPSDCSGESRDSVEAKCDVEIDGVRTPIQHPYTKRIGGVAPVVDWYDAIAMEDAKGRTLEKRAPWIGDDLGSVLTRAEHKIVSYDTEEVAVESFSTAREIEKWLDRVLAETQVRAEVWQVRNAFEADDHPLLRRFEDDEVNGWVPIPFSTGFISEEWLQAAFGDGQQTPFAHLQMSGAQRLSLNADYALSWSELSESADLVRDNSILEGGVDDWLVVHIVGSDVALPLPWPGANLAVHHDHDGATVGIDVPITRLQAKKHRKERLWESEWGRFLDDSATLTEAEVSNGIERAEAALNKLIAEEESCRLEHVQMVE
ncbi:hypothetical protein [Brevibacterium sp. UCMA 11752]|uniref:hypothetical protein n=1 Tax=Brevibacterium sp. UCMA 11752 TaxID=2745946 RepID=UPI001F1FE1DB|nr:hypothetical protein [Brevibacterium sp. UCMA 11752]MCF2587773.1 hypothetical protein [Brevibacterium sp. UCMA 11752]